MKWPQLVKPWTCKVPITITLTDGIQEDGSPKTVAVVKTTCNCNGKGGWSVDENRQMVRYTCTVLIPGDIAPQLVHLEGEADLLGKTLTIHAADRALNPDGSVNFTRLELM